MNGTRRRVACRALRHLSGHSRKITMQRKPGARGCPGGIADRAATGHPGSSHSRLAEMGRKRSLMCSGQNCDYNRPMRTASGSTVRRARRTARNASSEFAWYASAMPPYGRPTEPADSKRSIDSLTASAPSSGTALLSRAVNCAGDSHTHSPPSGRSSSRAATKSTGRSFGPESSNSHSSAGIPIARNDENEGCLDFRRPPVSVGNWSAATSFGVKRPRGSRRTAGGAAGSVLDAASLPREASQARNGPTGYCLDFPMSGPQGALLRLHLLTGAQRCEQLARL